VEGLDTVMPKQKQDGQPGGQQERELSRGVKLLRTLEDHKGVVLSVAFDPAGLMLASGSGDNTVKIWDVKSGRLLRTLEGHREYVLSVAFNPTGRTLASGSDDKTVKIWDVESGKLLRTLEGHGNAVPSLVFDPTGRTLASGCSDWQVRLWDVESGKLLRALEGHTLFIQNIALNPTGRTLASGSGDHTVKIWDVESGKLLRTLERHEGIVQSVAFDPTGRTLASGSDDKTVKIWDVESGRLLRTLEAHTSLLDSVAFSPDGLLLASKSRDGNLYLWNCATWETVAVILEPTYSGWWRPQLAFHPTLPLLASVGSEPDAPEEEKSQMICCWELDFDVLLGKAQEARLALKAMHHTTAKIVLVGDHSVGKSGLGWRLAHGEFKEQSSTHGQQFWVLPQLGKLRDDGTECEAILWDLAGQPDYRLIHALFLDDVDLALVLFDASNISDPLHGVEFWLKQLKVGQVSRPSDASTKLTNCLTILVGAQADRGTPTLTHEDLEAFCHQRGVSGYLSTSALTGLGLEELTQRMKELIAWEDKPATVTTVTFKRIKDYVLKLKENLEGQPIIVNPPELQRQLQQTDENWQFSDAEMMTAVGHLENYGYVKRLRTSKGEDRILLAPEILNNLAASFVLEARRNPKGLGSLEEKRLMAGEYSFSELEKLQLGERDILLDAAALLFLEHNVCFRETDPLGGQSYLVFPELINLKKPLEDEQPTTDGVAYTVSGAVENVYASLVVLLGYTQTFNRTNQWQRQARYVMGDGSVCGFRRESNRDGDLELVLYFGPNVPKPGQKVFEGLFESFLARRNVTVFRYEPVICPNGHTINRAVVHERLRGAKGFAFCAECGEKAVLQKAEEPIQLTQTERRKVEEQQWFAAQRTRFEQAVFQVMSYVKDRKGKAPECFISYAWGAQERERWVERNLATDLQKAGINVVLDRWENDRAGKSVSRFVSRIANCDLVIPVGTPLYFQKFENQVSSTGSVVAAEVGLISQRLLGTEGEKETVMPILLEGEKKTSLPPLMWDQVHRDFRTERAYFITAFDFILDLYGITHNDVAVADLRESLRAFQMQ
jgi:GTPase SAR1 family protein